jgi:hypothetical protein
MNKPNYVKYLSLIDVDEYLKFTKDFQFEKNEKYDRGEYFDKCQTFFLVERFEATDMKLCKKFFKLSKQLTKILNEVYGEGSIYNTQFSLLPPLCSIKPHYDYGLHFSLSHRIHLPIKSNSQSIFSIGDQDFNFKCNQLVEINNKRKHSVVNNSETEERIHLIIDYMPLKYSSFVG